MTLQITLTQPWSTPRNALKNLKNAWKHPWSTLKMNLKTPLITHKPPLKHPRNTDKIPLKTSYKHTWKTTSEQKGKVTLALIELMETLKIFG